MKPYHQVDQVSCSDETLSLRIDGQIYQFQLKAISSRLAKASASERNVFEVTPSGYGIRWPLIDEDLSVDGLLEVQHRPPQKQKSSAS